MATENESPAREPATRGRGRGGRGGRAGRGRGGGRGGASSTSGVAKANFTKAGRGGTRRGRAKSFADSRVQAAYERQRDLKATYQAVAHALKPALQELADRSIEELLQRSDGHRFAPEHWPVLDELNQRLAKKLHLFDRQLEANLNLAEGTYSAEQYVLKQEFEVCLSLFIPAYRSSIPGRRDCSDISLKGNMLPPCLFFSSFLRPSLLQVYIEADLLCPSEWP